MLGTLEGKEGYDLKGRIQEKIAEYAEAGVTLPEDAAMEEITADGLLDYIGTEKNFAALAKEDRSLAERIKDWAAEMAARIRRLLEELTGKEAEALREDLRYLEARDAMMEGVLQKAAENLKEAQTGLYGSAKTDTAVQEYQAEIRNAQSAQEKTAALDALIAQMAARTQRAYFAAHPEADVTAVMEKMKRGLLAYGQGKTTVTAALEAEGLTAPRAGTHTMRVMSYIGQQAAMLAGQEELGTSYSIKTNEDGLKYVDVYTDQDIFEGADETEYKNIAREYIKRNFVGKFLGANEDILVNGRSAKEYAYPANRRMPKEIKNGKYKAATELDNMLNIAQYLRHEETEAGKHRDTVNGWDVYEVIYKVGDRYFSGESKIKLTDKGSVFYDITKIRDITRQLRPGQQMAGNRGLSNASENNITEAGENVNNKFSLSSEAEEAGTLVTVHNLTGQKYSITERYDYGKSFAEQIEDYERKLFLNMIRFCLVEHRRF